MRGPFKCVRWLWVITLAVLGAPHNVRADSSKFWFDPRDCVCTVIREAPIDIFTARAVSTRVGNQIEVVEVLTHGIPERQVSGEIIANLTNFYGDSENTGFFLVYAGARSGDFYGVSIPSLDGAAVRLRTLMTNIRSNRTYDRCCTNDFSLTQLKAFADALGVGEGTCQVLATKYLGLPKPAPEGYDNAFQDCSGGGTSPDWLASILGAFGLLAFRAWRRRPDSF